MPPRQGVMSLMEKKRKMKLSFYVVVVMAMLLPACGSETADTTTTTEAAPTHLGIAADIVWGPLNIPDEQKATQVCVLGNRFPRNSEIVWRARVVDPVTGEGLGDEQLSSVVVELSDGQVLD